jgi:hypothetical protein
MATPPAAEAKGMVFCSAKSAGLGRKPNMKCFGDGALAKYEEIGFSAYFVAFAVLFLGLTLNRSDGLFEPIAICQLTAAFVFAIFGILVPRLRRSTTSARLLLIVFALGLLFQITLLLSWIPAGLHGPTQTVPEFRFFNAGLLFAAGLVLLICLVPIPWLRRGVIPLVLVTHFALGVLVIRIVPNPYIDVFVFQQNSSAALLDGRNAYELKAPNIYGPSKLYGPGLVKDGRLTFGNPYPPLTTLLATLGYLVAGDVRYAHLAAITIGGALMAYMHSSRIAALAACLYLFTPRVFFVVEQSWTEPFVVLFLAATVFCARHQRKLLPIALGLFLASKQYVVLIMPAAFLLLSPPVRWGALLRLYAQASIVALIVTLPFMLWNVQEFLANVVLLQWHQPFRKDALSYLALYAQFGPVPPQWIVLVPLIPTVFFTLWRSPQTPAGFAAAVALILFVFFAFSKQAFCNYYFLVLGALCCALAAIQPGVIDPSVRVESAREELGPGMAGRFLKEG